MAKKIIYNPKFVKLADLKSKENKISTIDYLREECYDWAKLKEDIKRDGLLCPIRIYFIEDDDAPYIADGRHRVKVLKELYSDKHLVPVTLKEGAYMKNCK
tara:strand:+ start:1201 stop:1503 length:303 start_codon:yes stop_codon:yes gene_type:complete